MCACVWVLTDCVCVGLPTGVLTSLDVIVNNSSVTDGIWKRGEEEGYERKISEERIIKINLPKEIP